MTIIDAPAPTAPLVAVKEPFYQAIGWLQGTLQFVPAQGEVAARIPALVLKDGTELRCSGVRQNLLQWAARHTNELEALWCVYPRQAKDGLTVFLSNRWKVSPEQEEPSALDGRFRVQGRVTRIKDDAVMVAIERNLKAPVEKERLLAWRDFTLKLHGNLGVREGDFCQAVCQLVDGRLQVEAALPLEGKPKPKVRAKSARPAPTVPTPALSVTALSDAPLPAPLPVAAVKRPVPKPQLVVKPLGTEPETAMARPKSHATPAPSLKPKPIPKVR